MRYLGGHKFPSGREDPGNLPHHPLSVATVVPEIRCDVRHAESEKGVVDVVGRPQIGALGTVKNSPGHLIGNNDGSPDGLFQGLAIRHRRLDSGPVDFVLRRSNRTGRPYRVFDHQMFQKFAYQIE